MGGISFEYVCERVGDDGAGDGDRDEESIVLYVCSVRTYCKVSRAKDLIGIGGLL